MGQNEIAKRRTIKVIKDLLKKYKDGNLKFDECAEQLYDLKQEQDLEACSDDELFTEVAARLDFSQENLVLELSGLISDLMGDDLFKDERMDNKIRWNRIEARLRRAVHNHLEKLGYTDAKTTQQD